MPKTTLRNNDYYLDRLEKEHPIAFRNCRAGKYGTVEKALITDHAVRPLRLADLLVPYATVRPRGIYPRVVSLAGCRSESLDASGAKGTGH